MATLKTAVGSLFGTIVQTTNTLDTALNAVNLGAKTLDDYLVTTRIKLQKQHELTLANHDDAISEKAAMEMAKRAAQIDEFIGGDKRKEELFIAAQAKTAANLTKLRETKIFRD